MSQKTRIEGSNVYSEIHEVSTHQNNSKPAGLVTYTTELERFMTLPLVFLNTETGDNQMAVDATFSGDIEGIHNGEDTTLWTASALAGIWDFASGLQAQSGSQSIAGAGTSNATALIASTSSIDMNDIDAFTGFIYLTSWDDTRNDVELCLRFSGSVVTDILNINDFVDPSTLNEWQKITIPKATFNLTDNIVNEAVFTTVRTAGPVPGYFLDTLQLEKTGAGSTFQVYEAKPTPGITYLTNKITITLIYPTSGSAITATTGMPVISHNKFGDLPKLPAGLLFQVRSAGELVIAFPIRCHEDLIISSFETNVMIADDNSTAVSWVFDINPPIILEGARSDLMSFTVSDDLSGLDSLKIGLQGKTLIQTDFKRF